VVGLFGAVVLGCGGPPPAPAGEELGQSAQGLTSQCTATSWSVSCPYHSLSLNAAGLWRDVFYQAPPGTPPAGGWPVVVFYQGSFNPAWTAFSGTQADPFGRYSLALTTKTLLDNGYAVVAPNALLAGTTYWQTNIPPWDYDWSDSADHPFVLAVLQAIQDGRFGALNATRQYAMGISSGGFMTSRMAVSYRGKFRALAIESGSYATCSALCAVPRPLPSDHPPTLFLHGLLDTVVPIGAMTVYRDELNAEGRSTRTVVNSFAGHQWIPEGPQAVLSWFNAHP
jgi:poly(3-hydroxybutyrate) depolymerase